MNKIRITIRTKSDSSIKIGDTISFSAVLHPSPSASSEYGYDFAKFAYFQGISAVGYAVTEIKLISENKKLRFQQKIENLRKLSS